MSLNLGARVLCERGRQWCCGEREREGESQRFQSETRDYVIECCNVLFHAA